MNPLVDALQGWRGPECVENALCELGYLAIKKHHEFWVEVCRSRGLPCDIDVFWRESALEFMSSGGVAKQGMRGRLIGQPGIYRSQYLDDLDRYCTEKAAKEQVRYLGALHPCVYHFAISRETPLAHGKSFAEVIESTKLSSEHVSFEMQRDLQTRKDAIYYLEQAGKEYGLEPFNLRKLQPHIGRIAFKIDGGRDLEFCVGCDTGGQPIVGRPPVQSFIYHKEWHGDFVYVGGYDFLMPGIATYSHFRDPAAGVIGIYALVAALKVLAGSFS